MSWKTGFCRHTFSETRGHTVGYLKSNHHHSILKSDHRQCSFPYLNYVDIETWPWLKWWEFLHTHKNKYTYTHTVWYNTVILVSIIVLAVNIFDGIHSQGVLQTLLHLYDCHGQILIYQPRCHYFILLFSYVITSTWHWFHYCTYH